MPTQETTCLMTTIILAIDTNDSLPQELGTRYAITPIKEATCKITCPRLVEVKVSKEGGATLEDEKIQLYGEERESKMGERTERRASS